jgi:steroid 5-alpha reductase family enzyme
MRALVPKSRAAGLAIVTAAYVAGAVAGIIAYRHTGGGEWLRLAVADAVATAVVFAFSFVVDNSSVYDPYWSVAPIVIAGWLAATGHGPAARRALVLLLVLAWALRLTWNWLRSWTGLDHEDWRYVDLRRKTGPGYWLVSALGLHFMPTVAVFLGLLPLGPALDGVAPLGALDALAFVVTGGAVLLETVADEQLRAFRRQKRDGDAIMAAGLWAHSRHPNYLGEVSFWWGLYLFGLAGGGGAWWTVAGAAWITIMFVFISVPMLDKRSVARRPAYADHMRAVPGLVPRPWRRSA